MSSNPKSRYLLLRAKETMSVTEQTPDDQPHRVSVQRSSQQAGRVSDGICPKCARLSICLPHHSLTDPVWYCDRFAVEPEQEYVAAGRSTIASFPTSSNA